MMQLKIVLAAIALLATHELCAANLDSLMDSGLTDAALNVYHEQFVNNPFDTNNTYNYSCLLARARKVDSAFKYAFFTASIYRYPLDMLKDPDFVNLYDDKRWPVLADSILKAAYRILPYHFKRFELTKTLWRMSALDQAYYSDIHVVRKIIGKGSTVEQSLWALKEKINHQNVRELESILAKSGWPKKSDVGPEAASAAFLIVQHSDLAHQQQYLPVIKNLCGQKEASWEAYALMYDRVQISSKKLQLYGSQVEQDPVSKKYKVSAIADEANVDKRRAAFGMEPLAEYLKNWDIVYVPVR